MENKKDSFIKLGIIFLVLYFLVSFIMLCIIGNKLKSNQSYVYYLSKIETIKNIVRENHQSKLFNNINSTGYVEGLNINYRNLMKVISKDGCSEGYKKCGILDTIGNTLCIDVSFDCPINKMKIDFISKQNEYLSNGYKLANSDNLFYNFMLYFSRNFIEDKICVSLYRREEKPNYINLDNFVLNLDAYRDKIGDFEETNLKNVNDIKSRSSFNIKDLSESAMSMIFLYLNKEEDDRSEKMAKHAVNIFANLFSSIFDDDNNKIKKFKKYVKESLQKEKKNTDIYYTNIGELVYSKNYIGFKNIEQIDIFLNFDFNSIYELIFPSRTSAIVSIIFAIFFGVGSALIIIVFCGALYCSSEENNKGDKNSEKNSEKNNVEEDKNANKNNTNKNENISENDKDNNNVKNNNKNKEDEQTNKNNFDEKNSNGNNNGKPNGNRNDKNLNSNIIHVYSVKKTEKSNEKLDTEKVSLEVPSKPSKIDDQSKKKINHKSEEKKEKNVDISLICFIIISILFSLVNLAFIIYSSIIYNKVNNNKILNDLKIIESDEFINNFINEFISLCHNPLCLASIIVFSISIFFLIISYIFICQSFKFY